MALASDARIRSDHFCSKRGFWTRRRNPQKFIFCIRRPVFVGCPPMPPFPGPAQFGRPSAPPKNEPNPKSLKNQAAPTPFLVDAAGRRRVSLRPDVQNHETKSRRRQIGQPKVIALRSFRRCALATLREIPEIWRRTRKSSLGGERCATPPSSPLGSLLAPCASHACPRPPPPVLLSAWAGTAGSLT